MAEGARAAQRMSNPVLVEVTRGALVESRHRGAIAVVDAAGRTVLARGDVASPVYPRSAVKALQALALVESGAADRFGFGDEELALACASHAGEPAHVAGVTRMLAAAGLTEAALQCGVHPPMHRPSADAITRAGQKPTPLHHNCSGKHASFLCAACAGGADVASYCDVIHPVQREVRAALENVSGVRIADEQVGIDGCSVPNFALPLTALARAFARLATGEGLSRERAAAIARLRRACASKPWHVAGTGMFVTEVMSHFGARVFVKTGAEGVCCAALPEAGLGIAVKCDDGAGRAAEAATAAVIARHVDGEGSDFLAKYARTPLRNWRGKAVGELRAAAL
jgi:L-asparaginase II